MSKRPSITERDPSATEPGDGDPFLSRWARRKRLARGGADPDAASEESLPHQEALAEIAPLDDADATPISDDGETEVLTDADMPALDSIDENTDMSGFFSPKVTQAVKKAALRKFFHHPAFNVVDGLDDYDDDFRNFEALGDIITSDMRSQMEREERARQEAAKEAEEAPADAAESAPAEEVAEAPEAQEGQEAQEAQEADEARASDEQEPVAGQRAALAADDPGVTREPGAQSRGPAKLRPRGGAGKSS